MNAATEEGGERERQALETLDRVFGIDLRSLALFRILVGLLLLLDLAVRATDLEAHYTDAGALPRALRDQLAGAPLFPTIHMLAGSAAFQGGLFALATCCAAALALGWRTRWAAAASWYLLASIQTRNPFILDAGDALLRMSLFWGMFSPLGARWSLDARQGRATVQGTRVLSSASAAILLQICLVYWIGAAIKSHPVWWEGDAAYYAFNIDTYNTPLARSLLPYPGLLRLLTWMTLAIEIGGPALTLWPWGGGKPRLAAFAIFCAMHIGFGLFLRISLFPLVCVIAWTLFLPTEFWESKALGYLVRARRSALQADVGLQSRPTHASRALNIAVAALLGYVILYNGRTVSSRGYNRALAEKMDWIANALRLDQYWAMFAPAPSAIDAWVAAPATLADGSRVDLFRGGRPIEDPKPADLGAQIGNNHRRKLLENMIPRERRALIQRNARYEALRWNRTHLPSQQLARVEVDVMTERTPPPGSVAAARVKAIKVLELK